MKDFEKKKTEKSASRAGFTLVELIVVIAILGILAGIAYPAYTGYIKRAQEAKVLTKLSEVVVAADSATAIAGLPDDITKITVDKEGKVTIAESTVTDGEPNPNWESVYASMCQLSSDLTLSGTQPQITGFSDVAGKTSYSNGAEWTNASGGTWTAASAPAGDEGGGDV